MKKLKFFCLSLVTLFLILICFVFGGVDASAYSYNPSKPGDDFTPYKDQIVFCDLSLPISISEDGSWEVYVYIEDFDSTFQFRKDTDFHPVITSTIVYDEDWSPDGFWSLFGVEEMYWNPWKQYWQLDYPVAPWGAPESAKDYVETDGKGIRLYFLEVHFDEDENFEYANLVPVRDYRLVDGDLEAGSDVSFGSIFFDYELIDWIFYYFDKYGDDTIPTWDRVYVYFDVYEQRFKFEYHGSDYAGFMLVKYLSAFDDGYNYAYSLIQDEIESLSASISALQGMLFQKDLDIYTLNAEIVLLQNEISLLLNEIQDLEDALVLEFDRGYHEGLLESDYSQVYEEGFKDGQESKLAENNEAFYSGIEKWLVPGIITVIALGGFVTIAARKRRDE